MLGKRHFRIVIPSEVEGSFLHTGIASYVRQRKRGNLLRKEQERAECKEDFSTALEMTVWGDGFISCSVQRICLESAIPVSSSRAKPLIFLAHRYSVLCVIRKMGMLLRRKQESAECEEDFSLRSK